MTDRPILILVAHMLELDQVIYVTYTIWFNNQLMKWVFYLVLFKTKVLVRMIEILETITTIRESRLSQSTNLLRSNMEIKRLKARLKYLFVALVLMGIVVTALRFALGDYSQDTESESDIILTYVLAVWYGFNILLEYYLIWLYFNCIQKFARVMELDKILSKRLVLLSTIVVCLVLLLANWHECVDSLLIMLNCFIAYNQGLQTFIITTQTISFYFNSI